MPQNGTILHPHGSFGGADKRFLESALISRHQQKVTPSARQKACGIRLVVYYLLICTLSLGSWETVNANALSIPNGCCRNFGRGALFADNGQIRGRPSLSERPSFSRRPCHAQNTDAGAISSVPASAHSRRQARHERNLASLRHR